MFVNDKIIYLQLQKTGCTHIARLLTEYLGGDNAHKHGRIDRDPKGRLVIGSVRNPWDWYVSLWAYGCMGQGAIRGRLTTPRGALATQTLRRAVRHPGQWARLPGRLVRQSAGHDTAFWTRVYADAADAGAFRDWLAAIHEPRVQAMVFEDDRPMPLHGEVGLYSARLSYLYSDPAAWDARALSLGSQADLAGFFEAHRVVGHMIRTENIAGDLAAVMAELGRADVTEAQLAGEGKTNTSRRKGFESYYDAGSIALVAGRDAFIARTFGYDAPAVEAA